MPITITGNPATSHGNPVAFSAPQDDETASAASVDNPLQVVADVIAKLQADVAANDGLVVHRSGAETITGAKAFSVAPTVPAPSADANPATKRYTDDGLAAKATDAAVVHKSGNETIDGVKVFSGSPEVPTPTTDPQVANRRFVTDQVAPKAADTAVVHSTGDETIGGTKTFVALPQVPTTAPTANGQVASKKFVDDTVATLSSSIALKADASAVASALATKADASPTAAALATKALDSAVVHSSGDETVGGVKTFSASPIVPTPTADSQAANRKFVTDRVDPKADQSALDVTNSNVATKAADSAVVHKTGDETISGTKTFNSSPVIPAPTADMHAATRKFVTDQATPSTTTVTTTWGTVYFLKLGRMIGCYFDFLHDSGVWNEGATLFTVPDGYRPVSPVAVGGPAHFMSGLGYAASHDGDYHMLNIGTDGAAILPSQCSTAEHRISANTWWVGA